MKRIILGILAILLISTQTRARGEFTVVATTPDLGAIARAVLGNSGKVYVLARPDEDPHYIQSKPSYMVNLRDANAVVYSGLQLEIGWLPKILEGARNPNIMPGKPGNLDASKAIERILEIPAGEVDRSMGDIHPEGNPHFLLDPRNGVRVARWMALQFGKLDPAHAGDYSGNAEKFAQILNGKIAQLEILTKPLKGLKIIAYHKQWEYLADWLGFQVVAYVEDRPGIPPSPKHIMELQALIRNEKINIIINANFTPSQAPEKLAGMTGAKALILPATVTGIDGVNDYPDIFDNIIKKLKEAAGY